MLTQSTAMSDVKTREAGDVFVPAQEEVKGLLSTEEDTTMGATAPAITIVGKKPTDSGEGVVKAVEDDSVLPGKASKNHW